MKSSTARQTQQAAYDNIISKLFTTIVDRPTRKDRNKLFEKICSLATEENVAYKWVEDYGYLSEIVGSEKYEEMTGL